MNTARLRPCVPPPSSSPRGSAASSASGERRSIAAGEFAALNEYLALPVM
jgi:hypothetical protein